MMAVPEAVSLPSTPLPVASENAAITSLGKPSGYVGNGRSNTTPQSSQCPAVLSLPADSGSATPCAACGAEHRMPASGRQQPRPSDSRYGSSRPPTHRATFPSVSLPASP